MKKILALLTVTACGLSAHANTSLQLDEVLSGGFFNENESVAAFTARMRAEIQCANLNIKLGEYREAQADYGRAMVSSYTSVSNALNKWDAELYRYAGQTGWRYTGALGNYANNVDAYIQKVRGYNEKLDAFLVVAQEKLPGCLRTAE